MTEGLAYHPLIKCDTCEKDTRHYFVRQEDRIFQCIEERRGLRSEDRKRLDQSAGFFLLIHRCEVCGAERGYGNRTKDLPGDEVV
jgi:hypothetical protein